MQTLEGPQDGSTIGRTASIDLWSIARPAAEKQRRASVTGPVPRVVLTRTEAAAALGVSVDTFEKYVQPQMRLIRRWGRGVYVPLEELRRVADTAAEQTIG